MKVVDRAGFEPATPRMPSGYSSSLSYRPFVTIDILINIPKLKFFYSLTIPILVFLDILTTPKKSFKNLIKGPGRDLNPGFSAPQADVFLGRLSRLHHPGLR